MDREHCFLKRNACLLKACKDNSAVDDTTLFELFNIRSSVLRDSPTWL
jgi:[histone H3]-lysine4 N-trimethyltransferase ATXR3